MPRVSTSEEIFELPRRGSIAAAISDRLSSANEDPFFVVDLDYAAQQRAVWQNLLPQVCPFYAVKCNSDSRLLSIFASLDTSFDCASPGEISRVLGLGVPPSRIIFALPCKADSWISFAAARGVLLMTFDSEDELYKIKRLAPATRVILRIFADDSTSKLRLSQKFGAPLSSTFRLLQVANSLCLDVAGISFHIGTGSRDPSAFCRAIFDSRKVYNQAAGLGFRPSIIDIGGGFTDEAFPAQAATISRALEERFGKEDSIRFIAEPGRLFASGTTTLFCNVIGRRIEDECRCERMIYINDGVYGNLMNALTEPPIATPHLVNKIIDDGETFTEEGIGNGLLSSAPMKGPLFDYVIWGRTCDSVDCVIRTCKLPHIRCGDWLAFRNMGAYSSVCATSFNGFAQDTEVFYLQDKSASFMLSRLDV